MRRGISGGWNLQSETVNRSLTGVVSQILRCFYRLWGGRYKCPLTSRNFIGLWKEKRYRRNMMFLFAGHSDKPLKSLISMAHKGNHICLYRFSFIYVMDDLWEDAYTCPVNVMNCTTESVIYVMELTVMGWMPIKVVSTKCSHFQCLVIRRW